MQKIKNEMALQPSSLETIDMGLFVYVDETLNLHTKTNKGFEKVPVIWLGAERSYQIKNNKEFYNNTQRILEKLENYKKTPITEELVKEVFYIQDFVSEVLE